MPDTELSARIAQIRREVAGPRGKAAFARMLELSPTTYQGYEQDRVPPAAVLVRMADVAEVDLRWLLTGRSAAGGSPAADHPVILRAAALLGRCPNAAEPLAAFVDILSASMKFPQRPARGEAAEGPTDADGAGPTSGTAPAGADMTTAATGPHAVRSDHWIPILGRSAAGVACFWDGDDGAEGVTKLDQLVARHTTGGRTVRPAQACAEGSATPQAVQLITLTGDQVGEVVEFVGAEGIKARHPDAFAVRIDGESMSPEIRHGDVVILSPSAGARDGHSAVVQLRRQIGVTCKLFRREGATVHLVPINEQFGPQTFAASELEWALRVLARVRPE